MSYFLGDLNNQYGCTDGGCCIGRRTGMHTNGGCKCVMDMPYPQRAKVKKALWELREEVERLEAENERIETSANAWAKVCGELEHDRIPALERENERLRVARDEARAVNERDRSKIAEVRSAALAVVRSFGWATEGRGSYRYDDDEYRCEFGRCLEAIKEAIAPLRDIVKDLTNCPTTQAEAERARKED